MPNLELTFTGPDAPAAAQALIQALAETAARLRIEHGNGATIATPEGIRDLADPTPDQILALAAAARSGPPATYKP